MVSGDASAWLKIVTIVFGLAVLASWYAVYKWSENGDHDGVPQTRATEVTRNLVNVAFVVRIIVIIGADLLGWGSSGPVQTAATVLFVGAIAAWAWFERERRKHPGGQPTP